MASGDRVCLAGQNHRLAVPLIFPVSQQHFGHKILRIHNVENTLILRRRDIGKVGRIRRRKSIGIDVRRLRPFPFVDDFCRQKVGGSRAAAVTDEQHDIVFGFAGKIVVFHHVFEHPIGIFSRIRKAQMRLPQLVEAGVILVSLRSAGIEIGKPLVPVGPDRTDKNQVLLFTADRDRFGGNKGIDFVTACFHVQIKQIKTACAQAVDYPFLKIAKHRIRRAELRKIVIVTRV